MIIRKVTLITALLGTLLVGSSQAFTFSNSTLVGKYVFTFNRPLFADGLGIFSFDGKGNVSATINGGGECAYLYDIWFLHREWRWEREHQPFPAVR